MRISFIEFRKWWCYPNQWKHYNQENNCYFNSGFIISKRNSIISNSFFNEKPDNEKGKNKIRKKIANEPVKVFNKKNITIRLEILKKIKSEKSSWSKVKWESLKKGNWNENIYNFLVQTFNNGKKLFNLILNLKSWLFHLIKK